MSALAEQHERWTAARNRLWVRAQKKSPPQLKVEPAIAPEPVAAEPLPPDPSYLALIISATGKAHFAFQETQFGWPLPATHWKTIVREVAQSHGVRVVDMLSARRSPELVAARNEAFYRCREETSLSLPQIGKRFNRDHTTIMYGIRKFQERIMGVLHDDAE